MDEALILQKLDNISNEVRNLKSDVLAEQELKPADAGSSLLEQCLAKADNEYAREDLAHLVTNLLANIESLNSLLATVKGTMELKEEIEPLAKLAYPMALDTASEIAEGLDPEQIKPLVRNTLSNLENFNTALNMLKAGMELKDEIEPLAKLAYPMALETVSEFTDNLDMDQVKPLIRNALSNLENFNTALTLMKAGMELKDEIEPLTKLSWPMFVEFFAGLNGLMTVSGAALGRVKDMGITEEQAEAMSKVIENVDLSKAQKVTMFGLVKKLNDPQVQEALGAVFALLETFGSLLNAYKTTNK